MTSERAREIVQSSTRCTQATLRAFGIEGYPYFGSGCLEYFTKAGFTLVKQNNNSNLKTFLKKHPEGDFLILTVGHAMALRDGILIDTGNTSQNKKIEHVWLVGRNNDNAETR